jgi:hypothetical protein
MSFESQHLYFQWAEYSKSGRQTHGAEASVTSYTYSYIHSWASLNQNLTALNVNR